MFLIWININSGINFFFYDFKTVNKKIAIGESIYFFSHTYFLQAFDLGSVFFVDQLILNWVHSC